jgi:hypothetical protein
MSVEKTISTTIPYRVLHTVFVHTVATGTTTFLFMKKAMTAL